MKLSTGLIVATLSLLCTYGFAQQANAPGKSNTSRLYIDFEVKNEIYPDTTVLNSIQLDMYEPYRKNDVRVTVSDAATGYTLVLYSVNEATSNRAKLFPLQKANISRVKQVKAGE